MNDSGSLLIVSSQSVFLDSTPVALVGGSAGQGRTFTGFLPVLNNKGEVVFIATLDDFSSAIFHWANVTLTPLVRQGDPSPAGGIFTRFFSVQLNDNGDVAFSAEVGSPLGIFHVSGRGGAVSKVVFPGDAAPGGEIFTGVGDHRLNNKGQVAFLGGLSNGRFGLFLASSADQQLELVAGTGSGPSAPGTEATPVTEGALKTARFPLGSPFFIQLTKKDQNGNRIPIQSTFTLDAATVNPAISEPTLFPNNVAIEFDRTSTSDIKFFQAVHLGNVILNITPTDSSISPVRVQIIVNEPRSLGTTNNQVVDSKTGESYNLDTKLVDLGHRRGIPPHFLKGQVETETNFDLRNYRYEPLSSDLAYMSSCELRRTNCNLRTIRPYSLYRLATADGLPQGTDIFREDISPRSIYFILRNRIRRQINDTDQFVSALEIYQQNDSVHNWSQHSPARARQVRNDSSLLDFTAQTPLAASYGFLQMLYPTAISLMQWRGVNGARNPSFLFDSQENLTIGGGSLPLGSDYVRRLFQRVNGRPISLNADFPDEATLKQAFTNAFQAYNAYRKAYGTDILSAAGAYTPLPAATILP